MIEVKGKTYEVRELQFEDCHLVSQILDKTGFDLKNFNQDVKGKRLTKEQIKAMSISVAADIIGHLIKNYHKAHQEAKELLSSLIGVTPDELAKMPITTPVKIVKELAKTEDLSDFLKQAAV